jgi:2',3'-cyclic-nucleotide 2'-phosphodiesterase (5'-nucleotidase family)
MTEYAANSTLPGKPFHFVISNMRKTELNRELPLVQDFIVVPIGGIRVGVIGIISPEAPETAPVGAFGPLVILDPVAEAMRAQKAARDAGADVVVCLVHMGFKEGDGVNGTESRLIAFANAVRGFAVVHGDHTDVQRSVVINDMRVVESLSFGKSYARTELAIGASGAVLSSETTFVKPIVQGVVPDAAILKLLDGYREQLRPTLSRILATSTVPILLTDACGSRGGRSCESIIGNLVTDAFRLV